MSFTICPPRSVFRYYIGNGGIFQAKKVPRAKKYVFSAKRLLFEGICGIIPIMAETKKENDKLPDETFRFRFSGLMLALFCLLLALCTVGFALTTWQFIGFLQGDITSVYSWIKFILLFLVSLLLSVLIIAMLVKSQYVITEKNLIMQFGLIRSRYEIKKIRSVKLFRGSDKLTVYFDDYKTNFMVIVVKNTWYDEFVRALIARNEKIEFDYITVEEEQNFKKKK